MIRKYISRVPSRALSHEYFKEQNAMISGSGYGSEVNLCQSFNFGQLNL